MPEEKVYICHNCAYYDWDVTEWEQRFVDWCDKGYGNLRGFPFSECKGFEEKEGR